MRNTPIPDLRQQLRPRGDESLDILPTSRRPCRSSAHPLSWRSHGEALQGTSSLPQGAESLRRRGGAAGRTGMLPSATSTTAAPMRGWRQAEELRNDMAAGRTSNPYVPQEYLKEPDPVFSESRGQQFRRTGDARRLRRKSLPHRCPGRPPPAWCRPTGSLSGFVFKIQANMDPAHRDRIALPSHLLAAVSGGG